MNQSCRDSLEMALVHLRDAQRRIFFTPEERGSYVSQIAEAHRVILTVIIASINMMVKSYDSTA